MVSIRNDLDRHCLNGINCLGWIFLLSWSEGMIFAYFSLVWIVCMRHLIQLTVLIYALSMCLRWHEHIRPFANLTTLIGKQLTMSLIFEIADVAIVANNGHPCVIHIALDATYGPMKGMQTRKRDWNVRRVSRVYNFVTLSAPIIVARTWTVNPQHCGQTNLVAYYFLLHFSCFFHLPLFALMASSFFMLILWNGANIWFYIKWNRWRAWTKLCRIPLMSLFLIMSCIVFRIFAGCIFIFNFIRFLSAAFFASHHVGNAMHVGTRIGQ